MLYTKKDVLDYIEEDDVKFIRLAFCDVFGSQKNISILPSELPKAFDKGISFDASLISGFEEEGENDLFLFPDPETIAVLPWRPSHGKVVRLFCDIKKADGVPYEADGRKILKDAVKKAENAGIYCDIGSEFEFYLFNTDENGQKTDVPIDNAGYLDIAPKDKGENIRREICLTLEQMGIQPISSRHKAGPGQNEIDFTYSSPLAAADNATTFKSAVSTIASMNGAYASFRPKPLKNNPGNGLYINISLKSNGGQNSKEQFAAGILNRIKEITAFLNSTSDSYLRLGEKGAPNVVTWSAKNKSRLIRVRFDKDGTGQFKLRSADPYANPYLAYALLIHAGIAGTEKSEKLPPSADDYEIQSRETNKLQNEEKLPSTFEEALSLAKKSDFVKEILPESIIETYIKLKESSET